METGRGTMLESILMEILARLPLRSIARFKLVCKTWKSLIESKYFRRLFVSLHRNSSSSWSLMLGADYPYLIAEAIGFHGCETWDLPKSLGSYTIASPPYPDVLNPRYFYVASSNGLIWINVFVPRTGNMPYCYKSFVGNPVLRQWVEIPPPPEQCTTTGLVTCVDKDGIVSSFKVVRTCPMIESPEEGMYVWRVYVYSSETWTWTFKRLFSSLPINYNGSYPPVNLNGMLYLHKRGSDFTESGVLGVYDFYGPEDDYQCQVIPLPLLNSRDVRRCLTTSCGDVFYIEILYSTIKVWRLKNSKSSEIIQWWELLREDINITSLDCLLPMAMNPFDTDIVYLWSEQHECLVSSNLRTQEFIVHHRQSENWSDSEGCWSINTSDHSMGYYDNRNVIMLSQFVLSRWMDSVPRPSPN